MAQITDTILMVRPVDYRMNEQTAVNNYFQKELNLSPEEITAKAQEEFDGFVTKLREVGVNVVVVDDIKENKTPDSIFPNNWISFHQNGDVALYPMYAENRRPERREDILETIESKGFKVKNIVDYTAGEEADKFLEGTGALILDRENRKAYCALSPRADEDLLIEFCEDFEYTPIIFKAYQTTDDGERKQIYHTNVMMCVADEFAVICLDCIDDKKERKLVAESLKEDGKEIIALSEEQIQHFAGNMLQVQGISKKHLVMTEAARKSLTATQIETIEKHCAILSSNLHTIETLGGGSARCMLAEVFLPKA